MRYSVRFCTILFASLLAIPALAQPPEGPGKDGDPPPSGRERPSHERNPEVKKELLELFDHNHDGTLDRSELMELRMTIREEFAPQGPDGRGPDGRGGPRDGRGPRDGERRGRGGEGRFSGPGGPGPDGPGPGDRGPDGQRGRWRQDGEARGPGGPPMDGPPHDGPPPGGPGPEGMARDGHGPDGHGPDGHAGPDGRPPRPMFSPERLFKRFDANRDGQLSMVEFGQLSEFVREHRPMGPPPGGPDGRRGRGPGGPDGHDGPPPRWRDRGDGRPGPPPAADDSPAPGPDGPPPQAFEEDRPGPDQATMIDAPSDDELSLEDAI